MIKLVADDLSYGAASAGLAMQSVFYNFFI